MRAARGLHPLDRGRPFSAKTVRGAFRTLRRSERFLVLGARMSRCVVRPGKWWLALA